MGEKRFPIVGVGASAGGLEAMRALLGSLDKTPGVAIIYVQHLDPRFESSLTTIFETATRLPVLRADDGLVVAKNHIYVAPPHQVVRVEKGVLRLSDAATGTEKFKLIDAFLVALAKDQGANAVGIILSGTMTDGTKGIQAIKEAGGITFAQDEMSAKFDGMPKSVAATGCVDYVLPPDKIARELVRIARRLPRRARTGAPAPAEPLPAPAGDPLARILNMVWSVTGTDFQGYKRAMIRRRVIRRMALLQIGSLEAYAEYLRPNSPAVHDLARDLLINVTAFFRDPELFRHLKAKVFPELVADRAPGTAIRLWVPGCSTGEEAYSLAISLLEFLGDRADAHPIQIFGTDLSEDAIEHARSGVFSAKQIASLSAERLRRFFRKQGNDFQIAKRIRDVCIFARHNLIKDPPFSRMDLISCQNVLIYLEATLQRRAIDIFHYSLVERGFLVLGSSEAASNPELFAPASKAHRVYRKRLAMRPTHLGFSKSELDLGFGGRRLLASQGGGDGRTDPEIQREADRAALALYAPPGVLVNDQLDIVQFRGPCSQYLEPLEGAASLNLFKMLHEDLAIQARPLLARAGRRPGVASRQRVHANLGGVAREIDLEVVPIQAGDDGQLHYLILFREAPAPVASLEAAGGTPPAADQVGERDQELVASLHRELITTKEQLRALIEETESTREELKSALEEVTSANEELQSINEELETAKEELQSSNEELTTVNEELQIRNVELGLVNADISNFISSVDIPIVMLGTDLIIRRYTPSAAPLLNLIPGDLGRPLSDLRPNFAAADLDRALARVVSKGKAEAVKGEGNDGMPYEIWVRPYLSPDGKIGGAVIVFLDVTTQKAGEAVLRADARKLLSLVENMPIALVAYDERDRIIYWNMECELLTGFAAKEILGSEDARWRLFPDLTGSEGAPTAERWHQGDYRGWRRPLKTKAGRQLTVAWSNVSREFPVPGWATWEVGIPVPADRGN